jgi:hypothetical protein
MAKAIDKCAKALYDRMREAGRNITPMNAEAWVKKAREGMVNGTYDELLTRASKLADEAMENAFIKKRNTALLLRAEKNGAAWVSESFKGKHVAEGVMGLIGGTQRRVKGGRYSADVQQRHYVNTYRNNLAKGLDRAGLRKIYNSGDIDDAIAVELYLLNGGRDAQATGNPQAVEIAKIVNSVQEQARVNANKYGANIKKLNGYITSQTHDMYKIRRMGRDNWKALIKKDLDIEKSFDVHPDLLTTKPEMIDKILDGVFDQLSNGKQYKVETSKPLLGAKRPSYSIASGESQGRVLHFKTPQGWIEYNKQAGSGNLRETVDAAINGLGESTGLMEVLGPNPQETIRRVINRVGESADEAGKQALAKNEKNISNILAAVDGSDRIPGDAIAARAFSIYRGVQNLSKLGGMVLSQISDVPTQASEFRYQGFKFLDRWGAALNASAKGLSSAERKDLGYKLNLYNQGMIHDMTNRFSGADHVPGSIARAQALFFKYNLSEGLTNRMRHNAAFAMSGHLSRQATKSWDDLPIDFRATMEQFNISKSDWSKVKSGIEEVNGDTFVTVEALDAAGHPELAKKFSSYFIDRSETAVLQPDARTQAMMRQGTQPGTVPGEFFRLIGQFKSFPTAALQKVIARDIYSKGEMDWHQAFKNGSAMVGLVETIVSMTLFGYMAKTAKDLLRGELPKPVTDPKVLTAAMLQGGGFGLYGDFFLGAQNRFGSESNIVNLLGPTASNIEEVSDLAAMLLDVEGKQQEDAGGQAFKLLRSNTPFANVFYLKPTIDYLITWRMQELSSPGYLQRMEARAEDQRGVEFWYKPSELID